jgi:hypothetical protein
MLQQGQSHVVNDIQNETSNFTTQHQKLQQKDPKQLAKISKTVQHHTLHGDPCATNILNFFLRNNIVGGGGAVDLTCSVDDDGGIDTVL